MLLCYTCRQVYARDSISRDRQSNMQSEEKHYQKIESRLSLSFKCGAIFLLFLISVVIAACGAASGANPADMSGQQVTVTISFDNKTPIPTAPPYTCSAWITQST